MRRKSLCSRALPVVAAAATVLLLIAVSSSATLAWQPEFLDPRVAGMGLAHVGVLGAPSPTCTNPASYGFEVTQVSVVAGAAFVPDMKEVAGFVAMSDVDHGLGAGGFSFSYRRTMEEEPSGTSMKGVYQVGKATNDWLSLGLGVGLVRSDDADPLLTTEAGAIVKLGAFRVGALVSDITATRFGEDDIDTAITPSMSVGVAIQTAGGLTIAADAHDLLSSSGETSTWYSGGAELWLGDKVALRGGVILKGEPGDLQASYTAGFGINGAGVTFGYAIAGGGGNPVTHCIGVGGSF
jgi:hypothetical protein